MYMQTINKAFEASFKAQTHIGLLQPAVDEQKEIASGISAMLFEAAQQMYSENEELEAPKPAEELAIRFAIDCDSISTAWKYEQKAQELRAGARADQIGKKANVSLPKTWTQAKSNIKSGLELGLNPLEYETESAFRKAKVDARKAQADDGLITIRVKPELKVFIDTVCSAALIEQGNQYLAAMMPELQKYAALAALALGGKIEEAQEGINAIEQEEERAA